MWGWIVLAKWRAELGISEWSDDQAKGKMAIQFDNGEEWLVELRGSGWIKDCKEGKSWRMKKLGGLTSVDEILCVNIEQPPTFGTWQRPTPGFIRFGAAFHPKPGIDHVYGCR